MKEGKNIQGIKMGKYKLILNAYKIKEDSKMDINKGHK